MRRRTTSALVTLGILSAGVGVAAAPPAASSSAPKGSASAKSSASASASGPRELPPGHPPMDDDDLPPGHPPSGSGHGAHGAKTEKEMPKVNDADPDPSVPRGTIVVSVRAGDDAPIRGQEVTLGIVRNTIAEGESRKRKTATTDERGLATFSELDVGSAFAYRVSVTRDGAQSAAMPFNLPETSGMRAILYAYPVVRDVDQAGIAVQAGLFLELRDDVIVVEQAYRIFNLGQKTWLSQGTEVTLPAGHKAFNAQKGMNDLVWDATKSGAKVTGTIAPGSYETAFRFHVPMPDDPTATLDLGLLPHVQSFRVIAAAPKGMSLEVDGFPPAMATQNQEGQRVLVTERAMDHLDRGFRTVRIRLDGIPDRQHKDARNVAVGIALALLAGGLFVARRLASAPKKRDAAEDLAAKEALLDALLALERAKEAGDIGPKTYEADKRKLLDALARLLAEMEAAAPPPGEKPGKTRRKARGQAADEPEAG